MATWRVNNSTSLGGEVCSPWQADHTYATGARCVCTIAYGTQAARAFVYEVTSGGGGKSHATTQPTWPTTVGNTVVDNAITWTCRSPSDGSWDNATCYLFYLTSQSLVLAGDTVYVDDGHSENVDSGAAGYRFPSTFGTPCYIISVDKTDDSFSSGAVIKSSNPTYGLRYNGVAISVGVCWGTSNGNSLTVGRLDETDLLLIGDNTLVIDSVGIVLEDYYCSTLKIMSGNINFATVGSTITFEGGCFEWRGGSFSVTSDAGCTSLIDVIASVQPSMSVFEDVDLSAVGKAGVATSLVKISSGASGFKFGLSRCKIPGVANYTTTTGTWNAGYLSSFIALRHCSSGNSTYDFSKITGLGQIDHNTSIVRTGGASDGTTAISAKMVSTDKTVDNLLALESIPITGWTSSTTEKTFTVEGVWDSATNIQDDEIWMEFEYPANNTDGLGAIAKDKCAILGTPADQTASTETWTGTGGFSNENKFKLSVTVTPGKAGPICARVYLAKASTTVYIDPMITES